MGDGHTGSAELEKPDPGAKEPKEKWSSHERATFWLESVGVLGVIGALLFSGVQLKTSNDALELTNEQLELTNDQLLEAKCESVYGHELDLWQLAVDHEGAMAPYVVGREMPPPEGDPDRARVDAAVANALDFTPMFSSSWRRGRRTAGCLHKYSRFDQTIPRRQE